MAAMAAMASCSINGATFLARFHVELEETRGAKGRVRRYDHVLGPRQTDEVILLEVGVQLDLQRGRADARVLEGVVDGLGLVVGDADAAGEARIDEALHGGPCLLVGGRAPADLVFAVVEPARRVAHAGIDVRERDGEVDEEEVKVLDLPVSELLAADGLDPVLFVERLPELGNDEEIPRASPDLL